MKAYNVIVTKVDWTNRETRENFLYYEDYDLAKTVFDSWAATEVKLGSIKVVLQETELDKNDRFLDKTITLCQYEHIGGG